MSTTTDYETFTSKFLSSVEDVYEATDPASSSRVLRRLIKTDLLKFTDMAEDPEKFFLAHRLLASIGLGGFGIRFTVQFNLFAGSILGLGGEQQLKELRILQQEGRLGCFLLTEFQAGVLSGLICDTTAEWDSSTKSFILHTPSDKAAKNWISQGYTAEKGVVVANLKVNGQTHGPHAFIMDLRDDSGALLDGIRVQDMDFKTIANDLDNARVWFDKVRLPKTALLNKFADIVEDKYVQVGEERMRIEVIGQRLLTGRLAIAEAALVSARVLHTKTERYAEAKICNGLAGERSLASMPQLKHVFEQNYKALDDMIAYTAGVEERLNKHLRAFTIPDADLVEAIAVCKIKCIEVATEAVHSLRQEVGSYALMHNTGFELCDMLLCCKFAEGDSRILQMKLARDRLRKVQKDGLLASAYSAVFDPEARAALSLARKLSPAGRNLKKMNELMDEHWKDVYALAELIAARHMAKGAKSSFVEGPIVERLKGSVTTYDHAWQSKL